jgi:hypothetical protein
MAAGDYRVNYVVARVYKNLNGVFMKAASVRGLICHTANEAGFG